MLVLVHARKRARERAHVTASKEKKHALNELIEGLDEPKKGSDKPKKGSDKPLNTPVVGDRFAILVQEDEIKSMYYGIDYLKNKLKKKKFKSF